MERVKHYVVIFSWHMDSVVMRTYRNLKDAKKDVNTVSAVIEDESWELCYEGEKSDIIGAVTRVMIQKYVRRHPDVKLEIVYAEAALGFGAGHRPIRKIKFNGKSYKEFVNDCVKAVEEGKNIIVKVELKGAYGVETFE